MSYKDNPYPKATLPRLAWIEGYRKGYGDSHKDHMEAMKKAVPQTAEDLRKFYEIEFKKMAELAEAKRKNKIM